MNDELVERQKEEDEEEGKKQVRENKAKRRIERNMFALQAVGQVYSTCWTVARQQLWRHILRGRTSGFPAGFPPQSDNKIYAC